MHDIMNGHQDIQLVEGQQGYGMEKKEIIEKSKVRRRLDRRDE